MRPSRGRIYRAQCVALAIAVTERYRAGSLRPCPGDWVIAQGGKLHFPSCGSCRRPGTYVLRSLTIYPVTTKISTWVTIDKEHERISMLDRIFYLFYSASFFEV